MFLLYFFEYVKKVMDWTDSPVTKVLNTQEHIALTRHNGVRATDPSCEFTMPCERELHNYLVDSYPPYFGLSIRFGKASLHCNHVVFKQY